MNNIEVLVSLLGGVFVPPVIDFIRIRLNITDSKQAVALTYLISFLFGYLATFASATPATFSTIFINGLAVYAATQLAFKGLGYDKSAIRKDLAGSASDPEQSDKDNNDDSVG